MSLENVHSDRYFQNVGKLYDHAEMNISSLQAISSEPNPYASLLSPILLAKLSPDLHFITSREVVNLGLTVDALLKPLSYS